METLITAVTVVGGLFAVAGVAAFALDHFSLPSVRVAKGPWVDLTHLPQHKPIRVLHVIVYNAPAGWFVRWFRRRQFAYGCDIFFTFWKNGDPQPLLGPVRGRWNDTPEPLQSFLDAAAGTNIQRYDIAQALKNRRLDALLPVSQGYHVAFLAKEDHEENCYVFNDETYPFEAWRKPGWELPKGTYLGNVRVTWADNGEEEAWFRLSNTNSNMGDFDMELLDRAPKNLPNKTKR